MADITDGSISWSWSADITDAKGMWMMTHIHTIIWSRWRWRLYICKRTRIKQSIWGPVRCRMDAAWGCGHTQYLGAVKDSLTCICPWKLSHFQELILKSWGFITMKANSSTSIIKKNKPQNRNQWSGTTARSHALWNTVVSPYCSDQIQWTLTQ